MLPSRVLLLSALAIATSAMPVAEQSDQSLQPRDCTFAPWKDMFVLDESRPDDYLPITDYLFQLSQKGGLNGGPATGRKYLLVHYPPTPYGSYGCQLKWNIPANTAFLNYTGSHQLDVKQTQAFIPPFRPTWKSIVVPGLGGTFGTVNAVAGTDSFVNTATCSNGGQGGAPGGGYGLAFVFKFADWVEQMGQPASLAFYGGYTGPAGVFKGPYLHYNC